MSQRHETLAQAAFEKIMAPGVGVFGEWSLVAFGVGMMTAGSGSIGFTRT